MTVSKTPWRGMTISTPRTWVNFWSFSIQAMELMPWVQGAAVTNYRKRRLERRHVFFGVYPRWRRR
eukprot:TsM_000475000 transcript=TsM_000475000 gene=TsM_000475000